MASPGLSACSRPVSRIDKVTPSLVWKVSRDNNSTTSAISMLIENAITQVPIMNNCRKEAHKTSTARDEQTRFFTSPMITEGERKIRHNRLVFVRGFKVSLITIAKLFDRPVVLSIEANLPRGLLQKPIGDPRVILNEVIGGRKNHRAGFLELAIVQQVRCRLEQSGSRPVLAHPIQKAGIKLQPFVSSVDREVVQ